MKKLILKLSKIVDDCGCAHLYSTNFPGLYLSPMSQCQRMQTPAVPPAALNIEHNTNVKLDYVGFQAKNPTQILFLFLKSGM